MSIMEVLPKTVTDLMQSGIVSEFVTTSAAGVPIDTPAWYFPSEGLRTFSLATGLAYPAKAERARKNSKVGLLIEGGPDEPVISIAGIAAVRDADLQANVDRYVAETSYVLPEGADWSVIHKAVWYWARIIVEVTPVRVLWWDNPGAMDTPPNRWDAPANTDYPKSDPTPPGALSASSNWDQKPWHEVAEKAVARGGPGHLALIDHEGYPISIRARAVRLTDDGFTMDLPRSIPWSGEGKASFTFEGIETFIGEAVLDGDRTLFRAERALPSNPLVQDSSQVWEPKMDIREKLMARLNHEAGRRGVPIPSVAPVKPEPTASAKLRQARRNAAPPVNF